MESKKIIFLEAVQDYGGARISTVELAERLQIHYDVFLVDFYGSCSPFVTDAERRGLHLSIIKKRLRPRIVNTSKNYFLKLFNLLSFLPHFFLMRIRVQNLIRQIDPDFIIVNNSKVLSTLVLYRKKKFKVVLFARGWFLPKQISKADKFLFKRLVDKYVCVSNSTRQAIYAGGMTTLDNLFVVHNAISESKLTKEVAQIEKNSQTTVILHSAGFLKDKGQLVSIEMARILKKKGINFKLILAGLVYVGNESKAFYDEIIGLINYHQLGDVVEIVLNKPNVISYFNACDLLIHPSETEGLPRVLMEAMILRKPVIANAVGGVTDYILHGHTGFLTRHNSASDYAYFVEKLIDDNNLYQNISSNAYQLIKNGFTEQNQIESLQRVFES